MIFHFRLFKYYILFLLIEFHCSFFLVLSFFVLFLVLFCHQVEEEYHIIFIIIVFLFPGGSGWIIGVVRVR